ncbi:MAG: sulfite exporter TauE/SafE family protein [Mailhella sp.]|nr:sulfite exporter TauE/SafE family protein [Mailhella sp.]
MENFFVYFMVAFGWFVGGLVGGATGVGGVMAAMPLLTLVLTPSDAVLVSCLVGLFGSMQLSIAYHKSCTFKDIRELVIGAVPGCLIGVWILKIASMQVLQIMVCIMIALFVGMQTVQKSSAWRLPDSPLCGLFAGTASGFVNSSVAMVGAPLGIYALLTQWTPDRARGNMSVFYMLSGAMTVISQACAGLYTMELVQISAAGIAGALTGGELGVRLGRHIDRQMFRRIVIMFLLAAAVILFVRAVRQ